MDLIVLGVGIAATKLRDKVAEFKSPILLHPESSTQLSLTTTTTTILSSTTTYPLLTERTLFERHREWKMRAVSLWIRQTALIEAKARGFDSCWAGTVDRRTIKATKSAIIEAKWVERRLAEALEWCDERDSKSLRKVVVQSKSGRKSRPRLIHDDFPESLLELPTVIPSAPSSRNLRLTIPMPPSIEENLEGPPPPLYSADLDEKAGEMRLENVRWDPVTTVQEVNS